MDRDLIRGARSGDEQAFARLADACVDRLLRVAHGILRDPQLAEDATQLALLNIWRRLPSLREPERFEAWSYRLVVNACYTELRRHRGWLSSVVGTLTGGHRAPDAFGAVDDWDELEQAFAALSVDHRAVIILHHYIGLPMADTARSLGIQEGTARSRLYYGMQRLRRTLDGGPPRAAVATANEEGRR